MNVIENKKSGIGQKTAHTFPDPAIEINLKDWRLGQVKTAQQVLQNLAVHGQIQD